MAFDSVGVDSVYLLVVTSGEANELRRTSGSAHDALETLREAFDREVRNSLEDDEVDWVDVEKEIELAMAGGRVLPTTERRSAEPMPVEWGWEILEQAAESITPFIVWLAPEERAVSRATKWILESARTTAFAIALLIRFGYLADGEARWRGLYEEACQMALLARAFENTSERSNRHAALAYLAHGLNDQAAGDALGIDLKKDYDWLRAAGYSWANRVDKRDRPIGIAQRDVFLYAGLSVAPVREELHHGSVHMSSRAAAEGGTAYGHLPPGADQPRAISLAAKTIRTLDDLVSNAALAINIELGVTNTDPVALGVRFHRWCDETLREL